MLCYIKNGCNEMKDNINHELTRSTKPHGYECANEPNQNNIMEK